MFALFLKELGMTPEKQEQRKTAAKVIIDLLFAAYSVIRSLRKK